MKFKGCNLTLRKRRGLSSVVGALLFVVLMVATFAVLGVALNSQTEIVSTGRDVADTGLKKQQEKFSINSITQLSGESLQVNVTNKGQNPSEIFTLVITNSSDIANGYPTQTIDIPSETSFLTPNSLTPTDIVNTLDLKMDNTPTNELFQFKIISSLGTIEKLFVTCQNGTCGITAGGGDSGLYAQFLMDGPNAVNTKNSTAVMFVTNTGEVPLTDVAPITACSSMWSATPDVSGTANFNPCELRPSSIPTMEVGQTAIFTWDGQITGEIDDEFQFCNQAKGQDPDSNDVFSNGPPEVCDELTVIDPNDCGGCGPGGGPPIILIDDLLIRPALFLTIPSPWGSIGNTAADGKGVWGVNMVNPTEREMKVNKVTIVSYPPGANSQDVIIPKDCAIEEIAPIDGNWSCPRINTIMWQDIQNPLAIPAYSSLEFLTKMEPGVPSAGANIDALIVQANAQTTAGSFGKADYQSTMFEADEAIVNIYLTNSTSSSRDNGFIQSQRLGLTELVAEEFKITLADMDLKDNTYIKSGARLIINVPREWTDLTITNSTNFVNCSPCSPDNRIIPFNDLSHQIIVETTVDIGGDVNGKANEDDYTLDAVTLTFEATPPLNDSTGNSLIPERLYIMYVLADGESGHCIGTPTCVADPNPIGPLSEIAIQVLQP
jgi:archaellum component FlaF (FlaF/FlaG flagellin family)